MCALFAAGAWAQGNRPQVSVADVKMLVKAGLSDEVIMSQIRQSGMVFRLTTAEILELKEAGASNRLIDFMINSGNPPAAPSVAPAPAPAGEVVGQATVVAEAPPPPVVERVVVSPGPGYIWVPGAWVWTGYRWTWVNGRWARPPYRHAVWVPGRWERRGHSGIWIAGRWR